MIPGLCQGQHRVGNGRRPGSRGQRSRSSLQRSHPFFQHFLGGIRQSPVNIPALLQFKTIRRLLAVVKHIGRSLVNRNRPGSRGRIRLSLPRVKLQCLEVICPVIVSVAVHLSLPFLCSRQCQRMISGL